MAASAPGLPGLPRSAAISLSSALAGARPVALTLTLTYEMQCGYPGPGPVTIIFPRQERLPGTIAPQQVLVDGHPARTALVSGHVVSVGLAPPPPIMCDVIGPGHLTIRFSRAARLGNPLRAGSYTLTVSNDTARFSARYTIRLV
jgi:hypothetical protein